MANINTDKNKIKELLERGVEAVYPDKKSLEKKLAQGERLRLYCGYDPSAPALHIGNAITINKLSQFQALGHEVIFLIGDFTGMIGDPTDKASARVKMSREEVRKNSQNFQKQAGAYLDFEGNNAAQVKYNSEWSDELTFQDLIELSSNFTVQQMIQRDMFQERLKAEKPIYLHEFLYPLAQGYDSVMMDVDLEVGGNDQMFNMMAGRALMKALDKREKFVMTTKLLADEAGRKMGKTEGNAAFLDTPANDMYGVIMSWPDGVIAPGFELCTKLDWDEVRSIAKELGRGKTNPRDLKMRLAREIVSLVHGEPAAQKAEEQFIRTFQKKQTPKEVKEVTIDKSEIDVISLFAAAGLAKSKGEARRLLKQGGLRIDDRVVEDEARILKHKDGGYNLQRGKRQFVKVYLDLS